MSDQWFYDLKSSIEKNWDDDYRERNCAAAKERKPYIRSSYPTDEFLDGASQRTIDRHMGIPASIPVVTGFPDSVKHWMETIEYRHRPTDERVKAGLYGRGLILHGAAGTGKTVLAANILRTLIALRIRTTDPDLINRTWHGASMGVFLDWQDVSELFRNAVSDETAAEESLALRKSLSPEGPVLLRADFLVLDDISRERGTEFNSAELHRIIRRRNRWGWTTVMTTNYAPADWESNYGDVLANFMGRAFDVVEIDGSHRAGE